MVRLSISVVIRKLQCTCFFSVVQVDDSKKLGEWAGLCKIDKEGKARKVNGCGVVVVKDYGKESQALDVLNEYFRSKK